MAYRERLDINRHITDKAICLSALAGNPSIDVSRTIEQIDKLCNRAYEIIFPYAAKIKESKREEKKDYSKYFDMLKEMRAKREAKKLADSAGTTTTEQDQ